MNKSLVLIIILLSMVSNSYCQSTELLADNIKTKSTIYEAKVVTSVLNMRSKPKIDSKIIHKLFEEDLLSILATNCNWRKVKFQNKTGWVHSNFIRNINNSLTRSSPLEHIEIGNKIPVSEANILSQLQKNMSTNKAKYLFVRPDTVRHIIDNANRHEIWVYKLKNKRILHLIFINNHLYSWQVSTLQYIR